MNYNANISYATAHIRGSLDYPALRGTVNFKQTRDGVLVTARISGLPQNVQHGFGIFAFHIHDGDSCRDSAEEPFPESGGHYNPGNAPHPYHAGDLPPLFGSRNGRAHMTVLTDRFTVSEIINRVVIIHRNPDDFSSQPSGNPGAKIACGKILAR